MSPYILLAKNAVENYIKERNIIEVPKDLPEELLKKMAGTFVTIEKKGELRGCIGTYLPTRVNIAEEIICNAVAAATEDYRFGTIKAEELPFLSYIVYVLSYPQLVSDIKELDPKKFGIIVKTEPFSFPNEEIIFNGCQSFKSGLLLPDLKGVDTSEKQFFIACQKGGINPAKEKFFIYKFTVDKFQ